MAKALEISSQARRFIASGLTGCAGSGQGAPALNLFATAKFLYRFAKDQGNPVPTADLTSETSVALIDPSVVISERKFAALTGWPLDDFVRATSVAFTAAFPFTSPRRRLIGITR